MAFYFGLKYFGGDIGRKILYPITLLVTFLHEFGHGLGAVLTGGWVEEIQINSDGSGWTRSVGGSRPITIMGGYLGSAIFGNLLFFVGAKWKKLVTPMLSVLILAMLVTAFYWYNSIFTTSVLLGFSAVLALIAYKTTLGREVLMFVGLVSIIYIIQDFNVGPSSDLQAYAEEMIFIPAKVWMYIWLAIAIVLFVFNLKFLFSSDSNDEESAYS